MYLNLWKNRIRHTVSTWSCPDTNVSVQDDYKDDVDVQNLEHKYCIMIETKLWKILTKTRWSLVSFKRTNRKYWQIERDCSPRSSRCVSMDSKSWSWREENLMVKWRVETPNGNLGTRDGVTVDRESEWESLWPGDWSLISLKEILNSLSWNWFRTNKEQTSVRDN